MPSLKQLIRRAAIKSLRIVNLGDIAIRHHWTGDRLKLHTFQHKGYWWYGKKREFDSLFVCQGLIGQGQTVIECGGHIGYLSLYFASLVGGSGEVIVFEPSPTNLTYLKENTRQHTNIRIEQMAVGPGKCSADLYIDDFSGQNNSLLADYKNIKENSRSAGVQIHTTATRVDVVDLDNYCRSMSARPDFIKIDIEGYEFEALMGMRSLLNEVRPLLMIEITEKSNEVYELLTQAGYKGYREQRTRIAGPNYVPEGNSFWLHPDHHETQREWLESSATDVSWRKEAA